MFNNSWMIGVGLLFIFTAVSLPAQDKAQLQAVTGNLSCTCGCGMTVKTCEGSMSCSAAGGLSREAQQLLAAGLTPPQVLDKLVEKYGEVVLAEPPKRGFYWLAWILPFALIGLLGFLITRYLKRWSKQPQPSGSNSATAPKESPELTRELDELLDRIE